MLTRSVLGDEGVAAGSQAQPSTPAISIRQIRKKGRAAGGEEGQHASADADGG